jgi:hypothetical protein
LAPEDPAFEAAFLQPITAILVFCSIKAPDWLVIVVGMLSVRFCVPVRLR